MLKLWTDHKNLLSEKLDMEKLLSILECYAEDQLFIEYDVEIEQLEKLIYKNHLKMSNGKMIMQGSLSESGDRLSVTQYLQHSESLKESMGKFSMKHAVRMSIFTIHEENDSDSDDEFNK